MRLSSKKLRAAIRAEQKLKGIHPKPSRVIETEQHEGPHASSHKSSSHQPAPPSHQTSLSLPGILGTPSGEGGVQPLSRGEILRKALAAKELLASLKAKHKHALQGRVVRNKAGRPRKHSAQSEGSLKKVADRRLHPMPHQAASPVTTTRLKKKLVPKKAERRSLVCQTPPLKLTSEKAPSLQKAQKSSKAKVAEKVKLKWQGVKRKRCLETETKQVRLAKDKPKSVVKQLLQKAKQGGSRPLPKVKVEDQGTAPTAPQKRVAHTFVLPKFSRSRRAIIPNKRFIEDDPIPSALLIKRPRIEFNPPPASPSPGADCKVDETPVPSAATLSKKQEKSEIPPSTPSCSSTSRRAQKDSPVSSSTPQRAQKQAPGSSSAASQRAQKQNSVSSSTSHRAQKQTPASSSAAQRGQKQNSDSSSTSQRSKKQTSSSSSTSQGDQKQTSASSSTPQRVQKQTTGSGGSTAQSASRRTEKSSSKAESTPASKTSAKADSRSAGDTVLPSEQSQQLATSPMVSVPQHKLEMPETASGSSDLLMMAETSPFRKGLLEQPLIVEGKRQRVPSLKVRMIKHQSEDFAPPPGSESETAGDTSVLKGEQLKQNGSKKENFTLFPKAPSSAPKTFNRAGPMKLQRRDKDGKESILTKRSGQIMLRKAKLQLNRTALNRSKAALARSLKAQLKREAKQKGRNSEPQRHSPRPGVTSPLSISVLGSGALHPFDSPNSQPSPLMASVSPGSQGGFGEFVFGYINDR